MLQWFYTISWRLFHGHEWTLYYEILSYCDTNIDPKINVGKRNIYVLVIFALYLEGYLMDKHYTLRYM